MKIILLYNLISGLILITNAQNCMESKLLEANCGKYCYGIVKPVLEYTVGLQKQMNSQKNEQKTENSEYIEEKLKRLETQVSQLKQNSPQEILKYYQNLFKKIGTKYYYIEEKQGTNWFNAAHKCVEMGGHLASIQNQLEFDALTAELPTQLYWIDLNDLGLEGVYRSLTTGRPAPFYSWHIGEPNDHAQKENCICLDNREKKFHMNDISCTAGLNFICEL